MHRTLVTALAAAFPALLPAQAAWTQLAPTASPSPRAGHLGITDGGRTLLFGGNLGNNAYSNELWAFDGAGWSNLTPASGPLPPGRDFYAAAYDTARGVYVLFGGRDATTEFGDTWEWSAQTGAWTQMAPAATPSVRRWAAMTYDPIGQRCILFGGNTAAGGAAGYVNDTWTWNGATWTQLAPATSPSIRARGAFAFDPTRGEWLYFGGRNGSTALGDTWIWNGSDWRQVVTANAPGSGTPNVPGLFAYGVTHDLLRDRHVIFGGTRTGGTLAATWEFDGVDWTQRSAGGPVSRTGPSLVFVIGLGRTFLFGGFQTAMLGDTWEYQTAAFPGHLPFGQGCQGGGGVPTLTLARSAWIGDTAALDLGGLGPGALPFLLVGLSNTVWNSAPLPLPIGLLYPQSPAGCVLLVSPDVLTFLLPGGATVRWALAIPDNAALIGMSYFAQGGQLEPSLSITSTAGVRSTIGAR